MKICCPKLPKDTDAKIGVRRDPQNPNKKQKIFGYNLVLTTFVEAHLKIELSVTVTNISGNADEGSQIIKNDEQIYDHHPTATTQVKVDIADAKYDITDNYDYLREKGSIPIIDYNLRRENLSKQALLDGGYDQNGWPFCTMRPAHQAQRLSLCCSASERANSTVKEDLKILDKPRILNESRANILAQMAAIVLLLNRAFTFIVKITTLLRKFYRTNDPKLKEKLKPPSIPKSIQNIIQLE